MENREIIKIDLGGDKIITITFTEFDEIDVDELTKIHYDNIYGEMVTISTLLNRVGFLLADMEHRLESKKLDLNMIKSTLEAEHRNRIKNEKGGKEPILSEIDGAVILDERYVAAKRKVINLTKEWGYINSLYWAIKGKDEKLGNISKSLTPRGFEEELIEGKINDMIIKKHEKLIKDPIK